MKTRPGLRVQPVQSVLLLSTQRRTLLEPLVGRPCQVPLAPHLTIFLKVGHPTSGEQKSTLC